MFLSSRLDKIVICSQKENDQATPMLNMMHDFHKHDIYEISETEMNSYCMIPFT